MPVRVRIIALTALIAALAACAKDSPLSPGAYLAFGTWGGDRTQVVTSNSATNISLACSFGEFPGNIALDADGRFMVSGSWNLSVGPILLNGDMPAQLNGAVNGNTLTIAIAVNDTTHKTVVLLGPQVVLLGPQVVVLGNPGTTVVCPL
jgi:hypothetical protein